jgi:hypothetical protein
MAIESVAGERQRIMLTQSEYFCQSGGYLQKKAGRPAATGFGATLSRAISS